MSRGGLRTSSVLRVNCLVGGKDRRYHSLRDFCECRRVLGGLIRRKWRSQSGRQLHPASQLLDRGPQRHMHLADHSQRLRHADDRRESNPRGYKCPPSPASVPGVDTRYLAGRLGKSLELRSHPCLSFGHSWELAAYDRTIQAQSAVGCSDCESCASKERMQRQWTSCLYMARNTFITEVCLHTLL